MDELQGFIIKQLVLIGHRKNYNVPFNPGVNIIYGDADTGKSSILRIIYYLLGGKQIKLDHEIASSVKYPILEIEINGSPYCISRDLYNNTRDVDVYSCSYNHVKENFPKKYASSISKSTDQKKSLSEFILEELNFPAVRLKESPTKDNSGTARLSILDLFKYMYLSQDDVGSRHMLNIGNYAVETKNREVLKYVFNVLDTNISDIEVDISYKSKEKTELENQLTIISKFLSEIQIDSADKIDEELTKIEDVKEGLEQEVAKLNKNMVSDNELYNGLKEALNTINLNIEDLEDKQRKAELNIGRFSRLKNDYENDVEKLKAAIGAKDIVGGQGEITSLCPICDNNISLSEVTEKFNISSDSKLKHELTSINRRTKDLVLLISENKEELDKTNNLLQGLYQERSKAKEYMDIELSNSISPYLVERDVLIKESAKLSERRDKYINALKIRNRQANISEQIGRLETSVVKLKTKLGLLREKSPSIDDILSNLSTSLNSFLKKVKIKNLHGVSISDKSYLPMVRNIDYRNINSGGLRTIVSIGYLASILKAKLKVDTNLPNLLMIDTVGKFLGKTPESLIPETSIEEDSLEGVSDPDKYKNLFESLLDIAEEFEDSGNLCQIILVDNDLPTELALKHKGFEVAHYRSNGMNNLPIGLIDDWDTHNA